MLAVTTEVEGELPPSTIRDSVEIIQLEPGVCHQTPEILPSNEQCSAKSAWSSAVGEF